MGSLPESQGSASGPTSHQRIMADDSLVCHVDRNDAVNSGVQEPMPGALTWRQIEDGTVDIGNRKLPRGDDALQVFRGSGFYPRSQTVDAGQAFDFVDYRAIILHPYLRFQTCLVYGEAVRGQYHS